MATERLSMRKIREILRQKWLLGRRHREVAFSVASSAGAVGSVVERARRAGLDWAAVERLDDEKLEELLYPSVAMTSRPLPDFPKLHAERKRVGVTLELLHLEYLEQSPDGYSSYTQSCEACHGWG